MYHAGYALTRVEAKGGDKTALKDKVPVLTIFQEVFS